MISSEGQANVEQAGSFVTGDAPVDVAVVVVTYNSADEIDPLIQSLRREAVGMSIRVVVADNSSADNTVAQLSRHGDVIVVPTGGNLGYAAGINVAMKRIGAARTILVLNPDLRVNRGAIARLFTRMEEDASVGAMVPRILDAEQEIYHSLRREPTLLRALGDGIFGRFWRRRPAAMTEYIRDTADYQEPRYIDWATGAALLLRREAAERIGEWDERFFLYSEETDYFRRLRAAGYKIAYEPAATVTHRGGASGASQDLTALTVINRIRYMEKHRPRSSSAYRWLTMLGEQLRRSDRSHTRARWALRSRRRWSDLPGPTRDSPAVDEFPFATVIIPAHNEAAVILRTLESLAELAANSRIEVIVACNGCTDDTVALAESVPGVRVINIEQPSKVAALNAADSVASGWPRIYLDADIQITARALADLIHTLDGTGPLAARPIASLDDSESSTSVQRYYRARQRIASLSEHLWGAGVYGVTQGGHNRFGRFPTVVADDLFVDLQFAPNEKLIVQTDPVVVTVPRDAGSLIHVLSRVRRGAALQGVDTSRSTSLGLLKSIRGPGSVLDAMTYALITLRARRRAAIATSTPPRWERDDSSRNKTDVAIDHVIVTRFNLPTAGPESLIRAQDGWLRNRVELFRRYTVPSIRSQTLKSFSWIVYLDRESPSWLRSVIDPLADEGLLIPLYRETVTWSDLAVDAREVTGARGNQLLTTNLDNDDAVAIDFVSRLQSLARKNPSAAIFIVNGLIRSGTKLYAHRAKSNAFCSVSEPWSAPQTAWRDWHTHLGNHFPAINVVSEPAWLQVIHGQNVSNQVHGRRVNPRRYERLFPSLLEDLPEPRALPLLIETAVLQPIRTVRSALRSIGKQAVLRIFGRDGLDRLKERKERLRERVRAST